MALAGLLLDYGTVTDAERILRLGASPIYCGLHNYAFSFSTDDYYNHYCRMYETDENDRMTPSFALCRSSRVSDHALV